MVQLFLFFKENLAKFETFSWLFQHLCLISWLFRFWLMKPPNSELFKSWEPWQTDGLMKPPAWSTVTAKIQKMCIWTVDIPVHLLEMQCSSWFSQNRHSLSVYFWSPAQTFLLLVLPVHRVHSTLYTVNVLHKFLTYLLTKGGGSTNSIDTLKYVEVRYWPKPMSNMRSASSNTKYVTRDKFVAFFFTRSISRP